MAYELIGAIVAAVGAAGVILLLNKLLRGRLPRWLVPTAAGLALVTVTIVLEYGWYGRVVDGLPEGVEVVWVDQTPQPLRPWTFAVPMATQVIAADGRQVAKHPVKAELRMLPLYRFARWRPTEQAVMVVDCAGNRHVLLTEGVAISDAGELSGADWVPASDEMGYEQAACQEG